MIDPLLDPECDLVEQDGITVLKSRRFEDIYFSSQDGLAETRLVFIAGNMIPERLLGRDHFVVAETGFGTGLNFLAMLAQLESLGDAAPHLHFISTEIAPLYADQITAALALWPEFDHLRAELTGKLPPRFPGPHRRHFLNGRVTLDLLYGDSIAMLEQADFKADAWFLDGFTPARNPLMWNDRLFSLIAEHAAPGGSLASFTAAGDVRRGLEKAGFEITRHDGYGNKRHRITGLFKGRVGDSLPVSGLGSEKPKRIAIIGAGIAGASVAASLQRYGHDPLVLSAGSQPADGASGNIAAVQAPRLTATDQVAGRFSLTAWDYARYRARETGASLADETVLLAHHEKEQRRQQKISELGWPEDVFSMAERDQTAAVTGIHNEQRGMVFAEGGTVDPAAFVTASLAGVELMLNTRVERIDLQQDEILIHHQNGHIEADLVVFAAGYGLVDLVGPYLPECRFQVTAGHVSHLDGASLGLRSGMSFGGYMARSGDGQIALGASFDHHDPAKPLPPLNEAQHQANLDLLPDAVHAHLDQRQIIGGRTSLRLASPDRQPIAGKLSEKLYVLAGLGARGMVTAPLLGEHIASLILGLPSPLGHAMQKLVDPHRFSQRAARRQSGPSQHPSAE